MNTIGELLCEALRPKSPTAQNRAIRQVTLSTAASTTTAEAERLKLRWCCAAMSWISLREAASAVPLATRKNTSSKVVTLTP